MSRQNQSLLRVAVLWHDTIVAEKVIEPGRSVTIGEQRSNTFVIPDVGGMGAQYALFTASGSDGFVLHLNDQMKGRLQLDAEQPLEAVFKAKGSNIPLNEKAWGLIDLGPLAVFFQFVGQKEKLPRRAFWNQVESSVLAAFLAALVLHFGVLIAAFVLWEEDPQLETLSLDNRFLQIIQEEPPPELEEEIKEEGLDEDVGKKAGGEEGKFGEEDKTEKSKVPKRDGEMVSKVESVGVHKALGSNLLGRGPLKNVFGDKSGFDSQLNAAMSGTDGELVIGHGSGGMGLRGTGTGGGGEGFGRIHGMGRIDTGGGSGTKAKLGGKAKVQKKVRVSRGSGEVSGFCKEADILRVVSARQAGIQHCYESELARNPELGGKVTMTWRIDPEGKVQKVLVENSTLGSVTVEGCIQRNIARWTFPKPEGGMCQIRFPFVFNAGL